MSKSPQPLMFPSLLKASMLLYPINLFTINRWPNLIMESPEYNLLNLLFPPESLSSLILCSALYRGSYQGLTVRSAWVQCTVAEQLCATLFISVTFSILKVGMIILPLPPQDVVRFQDEVYLST